ncbi:sialin-like [Prorops nasuta]|uniref:sialin-like n=1 Tax=Prorops nasuta TaxID=863751 RepID=UPI0034CF8DA0
MANRNSVAQQGRQSRIYTLERKAFRYLEWLPTRFLMFIMIFTCCWTSYVCRLQMPTLIRTMKTQSAQDFAGVGCVPRVFVTVPRTTTIRTTIHSISIPREYSPAKLKRVVHGVGQVDLIDSVQGRIINCSSTTPYSNNVDENGTLENVKKNISGINDTEMSNWMLQKRNKFFETNDATNDKYRIARKSHIDKQEWPPKQISFTFVGTFLWSDRVRGQLLAAYSYGKIPGNLIGVILTIKWGPRNAVMWTSLVAAFVSLLTPLIAQTHWIMLIGSRVIVGITGGVTFPACHALVSKWAPPQEKSRFVWSLFGGTFGNIVTYPMLTSMIKEWYWVKSWYIPSILMLFWVLIWAICAYDSPAEHPGITNEEKEYILKSQANTVSQQKLTLKQIPIQQICTSIPFISLVFCHFGNLLLIFIYQNTMIIYMKKVLMISLPRSALICSLPWIGRILCVFGSSWIADKIMEKRMMSITTLRKCATIFSHFIPAIMLLMAAYADCDKFMTNFYFFWALAFNGAAIAGNLSNHRDLSPNYAFVLYGIMNSVGSASGIFISTMVEETATPHTMV